MPKLSKQEISELVAELSEFWTYDDPQGRTAEEIIVALANGDEGDGVTFKERTIH